MSSQGPGATAEELPYSLVYVEWRDAVGCASAWEVIETAKIACAPSIVRSVGYLVKESEEAVVLVPHLSDVREHNADWQGCGDMLIPRSAIVRISPVTVGTE